MMTLPTAKILLFIALNVGPHSSPVVYATSNSESYVWTSSQNGWTVGAKGFPASDWTRDPSVCENVIGQPTKGDVPPYLRAVAAHNWKHDSAMVFDNGDRVEKCGDHAFYIINAGGANQKVFTILYPENNKS